MGTTDSGGQDHLSRVTTLWTLVRGARGEAEQPVAEAQAALIERYGLSIHRYLLKVLRNADAADEVFQQFAFKLVRGDLTGADPAKGRFRDYVKTTLIHLVADHHRASSRHRPAVDGRVLDALGAPDSPDEQRSDDESFIAAWREGLLARAWERLSSDQWRTGQPWYDALRLRANEPHLTSGQLADRLNRIAAADRPHTDVSVRKLIERARRRFAGYIVEDVAAALGTDQRELLERELIELGLHGYCRCALNGHE